MKLDKRSVLYEKEQKSWNNPYYYFLSSVVKIPGVKKQCLEIVANIVDFLDEWAPSAEWELKRAGKGEK